MKFSLNSLLEMNSRYGSADDIAAIGRNSLIEKIGTQLGAVEEVIPIGAKYKGIVIVKVVSCQPHPDADKLQVCLIDDGGITKGVKRDDQNNVQVVCGAPNCREGLSVAWLPPGSIVPNTYDKDRFVLEAREIRGVVSNGMLASPKELALGDNHQGILEIDGDHQPGTDFAEAFGLKDDITIDIENKMFTHRPDCFGFLGIARELAGIQDISYKSPDWYVTNPAFPAVDTELLPLMVNNELTDLVPRFTAITMAQVKVGPSPVWLQVELAKIGQKSINNIVDYTNYFMLQTGQPLHAYDYDKVKAASGPEGAIIVIRNPVAGEKLKLLNGSTSQPRPEDIMIATDKQLIGLGGVMGGAETEVDENTTNIILESANFDMYAIRRTSMALGLFTDAVTRFNKGQSPLQNLTVLKRVVEEIQTNAGGRVASQVIDDNHLDKAVLERKAVHEPVKISASFINSRLGSKLDNAQIQKLLENVEFKVENSSDELIVMAPFWRTDIELREDVVEEVGRLYGYDRLPLELPRQDITPAQRQNLLELKAGIRQSLSKAGANEVLTYSFVPGSLMDKTGQDKSAAFQIANALSPDLQYYRLSLTPSLLDKIHPNVKAGHGQFALFEMGVAHTLGEPDPSEKEVPKEVNSLSLVFVASSKAAQQSYVGAAYYQAKKYALDLLENHGVSNFVHIIPLDGADLYKNPWLEQMTAPYAPARSAVLQDKQGLIWGVIGEYKAEVRQSLKLPAYVAGFELDPLLLLQSANQPKYTPLPRFPKVTQDITIKVPADLGFQNLIDCLLAELEKSEPENSVSSLTPLDIYQAADDLKHKNISLRLTIASYDRTLTDSEVNKLLDEVATAAKKAFKAERV